MATCVWELFLSFILGIWFIWLHIYYSTIYAIYTWGGQHSKQELMVPAALTTAFMMPIIGKLLQKGVPQQYLVAAGMYVFYF